MTLNPDVRRHYEEVSDEAPRLTTAKGRLEFERTWAVLQHELAPASQILDVGGAAGVYAAPLAKLGHAVSLIDPVERHVRQATEASAAQPEAPFTAELGDARDLDRSDGCVDAVLMLGPLYHLPDADDRAKAIGEAFRVLRPGGVAVFASCSRFASVIDGVLREFLLDPTFAAIVEGDLATGHHRNPGLEHEYFTDAYLHRAADLGAEVRAGGFDGVRVVAVEGFAALLPDLDDRLDDRERARILFEALAAVEEEPSMIDCTFHHLAIGRRPAV